MPPRRPASPWRKASERLRWAAVRGWRHAAPLWPLALAAAAIAFAAWAPAVAWSPVALPVLPFRVVVWGALAGAAAAGLATWRRGGVRVAAADAGFLGLAAAAVHLGAVELGPLRVAGAPLSGAVVLVAAARFSRWWAPAAAWGVVVALEAARAALLAPEGEEGTLAAAVSLGALAALAAVAGFVFRRDRRGREELEREVESHRRLRDEAQHYGALAEHRRSPSAEHLAPEQREARALSVVVERERLLERFLELGRLSVGARGLFLFLLGDDGEVLALRGAASADDAPLPDAAASARPGEGVIGECTRAWGAPGRGAGGRREPARFSLLEPDQAGARLWADGSHPVSLLVAAVEEDGVFRGVLAADSGDPAAFAPVHEGLLERFAAEIGAQLASSRAGLRRERHGLRLETLVVISRELSSTLVQQEVLEKMLDKVRELVPYDRSAYYRADPEMKRLHLSAQRGFDVKAGREVSLAYGRGPAGTIAKYGRRILFTDLRARSRGVEVVPKAGGQERIAALVGVPLVHRGELLGAWVLASDTRGKFTAEHLEILELVASEAAVLIANAGLHETIERLAVTDGLTGLYNHRHFQEQLGNDLVRAGRTGDSVSLVLMDIDHFKRINDAHGHPFGDEVLRVLGRTLGKLARRADLVARYGGEEFALILHGTDRRGCGRMAERILTAVRAIRVPREGDEDFSFTASLGTATWPADGATREELVQAADRALYAAKHGGRDRAVAHEELGRLL